MTRATARSSPTFRGAFSARTTRRRPRASPRAGVSARPTPSTPSWTTRCPNRAPSRRPFQPTKRWRCSAGRSRPPATPRGPPRRRRARRPRPPRRLRPTSRATTATPPGPFDGWTRGPRARGWTSRGREPSGPGQSGSRKKHARCPTRPRAHAACSPAANCWRSWATVTAPTRWRPRPGTELRCSRSLIARRGLSCRHPTRRPPTSRRSTRR